MNNDINLVDRLEILEQMKVDLIRRQVNKTLNSFDDVVIKIERGSLADKVFNILFDGHPELEGEYFHLVLEAVDLWRYDHEKK